jgi:hypothetical protein
MGHHRAITRITGADAYDVLRLGINQRAQALTSRVMSYDQLRLATISYRAVIGKAEVVSSILTGSTIACWKIKG